MTRLAAVTLLLCCGGVFSAQTSFEPVGSIPGPADVVRVQGAYAYVAAGKTLAIFDVSNPASPKREGAYTFPQEIWGFRLVRSRAYVGANFFGLGILDVSDAAQPTLVGSFKSLGQTKIGDVFENKVVLIDHMEGLVMLDVSNESEPAGAGSFFLDGYARDVVTSGSMAYAVDSPSGLYVFDLSQPGVPEPVGVLHAPQASHFIEASAKLVCGMGGRNLQVYDVSNPAAPVKAATFPTPGRGRRVSLRGTRAYIADGEAGIHVVDLAEPSRPRLVATYETPSPARDVAATDALVFVVVGEDEVLILRETS